MQQLRAAGIGPSAKQVFYRRPAGFILQPRHLIGVVTNLVAKGAPGNG